MTKQQQTYARQLAERGTSVRDIAVLTQSDVSEVRRVLCGSAGELLIAKRQLLRRVPSWWRGTESDYFRVVEFNFADVA